MNLIRVLTLFAKCTAIASVFLSVVWTGQIVVMLSIQYPVESYLQLVFRWPAI